MAHKKSSADQWLLLITFCLLALGTFMVFDASYAQCAERNNPYYFLTRQLIFVGVAIVALIGGIRYDYWKYRKLCMPLVGIMMVSLLLVFVPGIGHESNGARRWIGRSMYAFQPSEIAKLIVVLYLANVLANKMFTSLSIEKQIIMAGIVLVCMALIVFEPDLGTAIALSFGVFAVLFLGGIQKRQIVLVLVFALLGGWLMVTLESYRLRRFAAWPDPMKCYYSYGFQVMNSLVALGSGGPTGRGLCASIQKFRYLPACHTDFIFAILGEETGLIGTLGLLACYGLLFWRGLSIAIRAKDRFAMLLAAGITCMITAQALINIAVVTCSIPATGVPLPFISYGGTSLVITMFSMGVLLNISRNLEYVPERRFEDESDSNGRRDRRTYIPSSERRRGAYRQWQEQHRNTVHRHR